MRKLRVFVFLIILTLCFLLSATPNVRADQTTNYEELFTRALLEANAQITNDLIDAFYADTFAFMEELAFQNAQVKQSVIDLFTGDYVTEEQLYGICSQYDSYSDALDRITVKRTTQSEKDFRKAFSNAIKYKRETIPSNYREFSVMFDEIMTVNDRQSEGFSDELARAGIANPAELIRLLAKEDDSVQERALSFLWSQYYTYRGTILKEKLTEIRETEDFTAEELALLDTIVGYYVDSPTVPVPADPYPEELEAWLAKKNPQATEPSETDPPPEESDPLPTETDPLPEQTDPADPKPTQPAQQESGGLAWVWMAVGVCAAGAAGVWVGNRLDRKKNR